MLLAVKVTQPVQCEETINMVLVFKTSCIPHSVKMVTHFKFATESKKTQVCLQSMGINDAHHDWHACA